MIYLKKFEGFSEESQVYWEIPNKMPDLEICLNKIPNCGVKISDVLYSDDNSTRYLSDSLFIFKNLSFRNDGNLRESWSISTSNSSRGYTFLGKITPTEEDLSANKYNL